MLWYGIDGVTRGQPSGNFIADCHLAHVLSFNESLVAQIIWLIVQSVLDWSSCFICARSLAPSAQFAINNVGTPFFSCYCCFMVDGAFTVHLSLSFTLSRFLCHSSPLGIRRRHHHYYRLPPLVLTRNCNIIATKLTQYHWLAVIAHSLLFFRTVDDARYSNYFTYPGL